MSIKLIALDLDGTTLNSAKRISERTCVALETAAKQGVHIVVATGKPLPHSLKMCFISMRSGIC